MLDLLLRICRSRGERATFLRFATVGVTISGVDAGGLYLLMAAGLDPYLGRVFSYTAAMAAGYFLNRYFTFHHRETARALWHSLLRHFSVHSVGGAINFGVFSLVLLSAPHFGREVAASSLVPLFGVWLGGMAGLCFNFFFSRRLVFDN
jgi:putative flippase GtrA